MFSSIASIFGPAGGAVVSKTILHEAQQAQYDRQTRIEKAWKAYNGQIPGPLKVDSRADYDDNVSLNYSRLLVDKGVSFLFGSEVDFDANGGTSTMDAENGGDENSTDRLLDAIWKQNKKMSLLHEIGVNGGVCGDAYLKLMPPPKGKQYPRIVVLDPATVTPILDPHDYKQVLEYRIEWNAIDPLSGKPVAYRQVFALNDADAWVITDSHSPEDSNQWIVDNVEIWPYEFCPIFHCQNLPAPNTFWGISDLEDDILAVNRAMSMVMSNMNRILRFHAHPKTVATGLVTGQQINVGVDQMIVLPNPEATLKNLEMQSDLGSSLEVYRRLKEAMHEMARVPEIATGKMDNVGQLSGVALEILYQSLIEKTATKRLLYGDLLAEVSAAMLEMAGAGSGIEITLHWPDILPTDDYQTAQTALLYDQLGVSKATLLQRLGFDPELEADKKADEQASAQQIGADMLAQFDKGALPGQAEQEDDNG